jgi:cell wall assembly regulator SMI1
MSTSIHDAWTRIAAWFQQNAPGDFELIQGPASSEELDAAATQFGVDLPEDFKQLYQLMNGTDPNGRSVGLFPSVDDFDEMPYGPLALDQIVREWEVQKELLEGGDFEDCEPESCDPGVINEFWNVGWIPFAGNGGGDLYCIDLVPTGDGTKGQVITHSHECGDHIILAASLAEYYSKLADALDAGDFKLTAHGLQKKD